MSGQSKRFEVDESTVDRLSPRRLCAGEVRGQQVASSAVLVAVESGGELSQRDENAASRGRESAEDRPFLHEQIGQCGVDGGATALGEMDEHPASVSGIRPTFDPAAGDGPSTMRLVIVRW